MRYPLFLFVVIILLNSCSSDEDANSNVAPTIYIDSSRIEITEVLDLGKKPSILQGLAVYDNMAFQFYSSSVCKIFNLDSKELISTMNLPEGHYGSVEFSHEYVNPTDNFPLLYVGGEDVRKS
jgi:hypothetical protein